MLTASALILPLHGGADGGFEQAAGLGIQPTMPTFLGAPRQFPDEEPPLRWTLAPAHVDDPQVSQIAERQIVKPGKV